MLLSVWKMHRYLITTPFHNCSLLKQLSNPDIKEKLIKEMLEMVCKKIELEAEQSATLIQSNWRQVELSSRYQHLRRRIITIQGIWRRHQHRSSYNELEILPAQTTVIYVREPLEIERGHCTFYEEPEEDDDRPRRSPRGQSGAAAGVGFEDHTQSAALSALADHKYGKIYYGNMESMALVLQTVQTNEFHPQAGSAMKVLGDAEFGTSLKQVFPFTPLLDAVRKDLIPRCLRQPGLDSEVNHANGRKFHGDLPYMEVSINNGKADNKTYPPNLLSAAEVHPCKAAEKVSFVKPHHDPVGGFKTGGFLL